MGRRRGLVGWWKLLLKLLPRGLVFRVCNGRTGCGDGVLPSDLWLLLLSGLIQESAAFWLTGFRIRRLCMCLARLQLFIVLSP